MPREPVGERETRVPVEEEREPDRGGGEGVGRALHPLLSEPLLQPPADQRERPRPTDDVDARQLPLFDPTCRKDRLGGRDRPLDEERAGLPHLLDRKGDRRKVER